MNRGPRYPGIVRLLAALAMLAAGPRAGAGDAVPGPGIDWRLTAAEVAARCEAAVTRARDRVASLLGEPGDEAPALPRLVALEHALADLDDELIAETLLASTGAEAGLREASSRCREAVAGLGLEVAAEPRLAALAAAARTEARRSSDRRLADYYLQQARESGAHLAAGPRAELRALLGRISELETAFQAALASENASIGITDDEAAALPPSLLASLERTETGYRVPVSFSPLYRQFMAAMPSAAARERYLRAFFRLGGEENLRRVEEAAALRRKAARIAGYGSWAEYRLEAMMAGSPEDALALLLELDAALMDKARAEMAELAALKAEDGAPGPLAAWDYPYYQARLEADRHDVVREALRRFFPVERVVPAVMDVYGELLGIRFLPVEEEAWAPGVMQFAIAEAGTTEPIAWALVDLVPRPGRFTRPASHPIRPGRRLPGGEYVRPVSAIIGNGPQAAPGEPALFSHQDLVEFFHEFGHLMDTTLSTAPYASLYGLRWPRDFVEAPSQMLENWAWDPEILVRVSSHVETGEPMPAPLARAVAGMRQGATGVFWTRQAFLAVYDLALHGAEPGQGANALWFELQPRLTPLPPVPDTLPPAGFLPVMGGYDANYYGYIWSRVYARDLFTAFEKAGLTDPGVGRRFRRTVLGPGASRPPGELVEEFLGRPVSPEAFYRELGIGR